MSPFAPLTCLTVAAVVMLAGASNADPLAPRAATPTLWQDIGLQLTPVADGPLSQPAGLVPLTCPTAAAADAVTAHAGPTMTLHDIPAPRDAPPNR